MARLFQRFMTHLLQCRLFESVTTFIMLGIAMTVILYPPTIVRGEFRYIGFSPLTVVLFFGLVGSLRVIALYSNGRLPMWGPRLRFIGALAGAGIWCWMCSAVVLMGYGTGTLPLHAFVWFGLALGEIISCARAGADVRTDPGQ